MDNNHKILICYWDTGGGHINAAEAIQNAILELKKSTSEIETFLESTIEKSDHFNHMFIGLYNYLLREHPSWMKYYHWFIECVKPNNSQLGYKLFGSYPKKMLIKFKPKVLVSVHPMLNHYMALARKELGLVEKMKFVIVVTDPNAELWSGWACHDADLIIAPNDLAKNRLIEMGIPAERIQIIGMPIGPEFLHPCIINKEEALAELGLQANRLTICLSGGWVGNASIFKVYQELEKVKIPIQVVVLCGHNDQLVAEMEQRKKLSKLPTTVLPYSESLSRLMSACDLLVTKAGGLTTFEAIARRLPMAIDLLTEPMPQEIGTANMLIEANLAKPLEKPEDIIQIVESLKPIADRQSQALPTVHSLDQVNAVYTIAETLMAMCAPSSL